MNKEDLLLEKEAKSNKILVNSIIVMDISVLIIWLLNMMRIFVLDEYKFSMVVLFLELGSIIPVSLVYFFKINEWYVKYTLITLVTILIGTSYVFLTYHVLIMFMYPIVLASLYYNRKLLKYTEIITIVVMLVSHILAPFKGIVFDGFLVTLKSSLLFGFIPRVMVYATTAPLIIKFTDILYNNINSELDYYIEIQRNRNGIEKVLNETNYVVEKKAIDTFFKDVIKVIINITKYIADINDDINVIVALKYPGSDYKYVDKDFNEIHGDCFVKDGCIIINDSYGQIKTPVYISEKNGEISFKDDCIVMTMYDDKFLNCLIKLNVKIDKDDDTAKDVLTVLYDTIKIDIMNAFISEEMNVTQEKLIYSFSDVSESRSGELGQHVKRMSEYMKIIGKKISKNDEEFRALCIAVMLHDIGKLTIAPTIIDKPGKLTNEEFEEIRKHTTIGGELLSNAPGQMMSIAKLIAENHHERWDGKGYKGLKGEEIDYYSQYVAVLDVFDALVSRRVYKEPWPMKDAYNEIVNNKGTQFSPRAVEVFIECFEDIKDVFYKYPDCT